MEGSFWVLLELRACLSSLGYHDKHYRLGGLNRWNLFSHFQRLGSPTSRCQPIQLPSKDPLSGFQVTSSCSIFTWWGGRKREVSVGQGVRSTFPFLIKTIIPSSGPTLMTSLKSNYFPMAPLPHTISLGVRASTNKFGGNTLYMTDLNATQRTSMGIF